MAASKIELDTSAGLTRQQKKKLRLRANKKEAKTKEAESRAKIDDETEAKRKEAADLESGAVTKAREQKERLADYMVKRNALALETFKQMTLDAEGKEKEHCFLLEYSNHCRSNLSPDGYFVDIFKCIHCGIRECDSEFEKTRVKDLHVHTWKPIPTRSDLPTAPFYYHCQTCLFDDDMRPVDCLDIVGPF